MLSAARRHRALIDSLTASGTLTDRRLAAAFRAVPRHFFIPLHGAVTTSGDPLDADRAPERWLEAAYADEPVVVQIDDGDPERPEGVPTSSCSAPGIVARMLEAARLQDGQRVLEVGTGTGWNAALLAARLGDDRVVSVEIDPEVLEGARAALVRADRTPRTVRGDGEFGYPEGAPYHRVIATCAATRVPRAWVRQTVEGGLVVLPWTAMEGAGVLARLTVHGDGSASGPFLGGLGFMPLRSQRPPPAAAPPPEAEPDETRLLHGLDPIAPLTRFSTAFAVTVAVHRWRMGLRPAPGGTGRQVWLASSDGESWARVLPAGTAWRVEQAGPRSLWDEVEDAQEEWHTMGEPPPERYGLTVAADGRHRVWLDTPDGPGWDQD